MRIGVVGLGRLGNFFARTLAEHPDVNRLLLAGSRPDSAIALADELGMVFVDPASGRVANPRPPGDSRTALAAATAAGRSAIEHRPVRLSELTGTRTSGRPWPVRAAVHSR